MHVERTLSNGETTLQTVNYYHNKIRMYQKFFVIKEMQGMHLESTNQWTEGP